MRQTKRHHFRTASGKRKRGEGQATASIECLEERRLLTHVIELSSLLAVNGGDGSTGFVLNGIDVNDFSGFPVSSAGDVNGDGFDDLIIGAYGGDPNATTYAGESYVVFGKAGGFTASLELSSLDGNNGFVINGIDAYDYSGYSVSSAGDVNGDGFDDLIIGAFEADPNSSNYEYDAGESYVVFGKAAGFAASLDLSSLDGSNGFVIKGVDKYDESGLSVSSAGDINGDGFDDLIIGTNIRESFDSNWHYAGGESYVVFGKAGGFAASLELSSLDGSNGFAIIGIDKVLNPFPPLHASVSSAGDVNGDGFDDVIIGVQFADSNGTIAAGESYVIFGKASGFAASLELSSLDGSNGFAIRGIDTNDGSGYSVSAAGDVNGDGFDDLIIGAKWADPNGISYAGETYVVFGKASGFGASLVLSSLDGSNGFVINGINTNDHSGESVSSAGDVNGDGFDDLIIGAYYADPNGNSSAGESYVVYGKASGFAASLELSALDGSNGFVINGIAAGDYSGGVSSAGDVNGDGFDDLIIGSWASPNGITYAGESYVLFGGDFTSSVSQLGDANANTLTGTSAAEVLIGAQGDDTLVGAGGADVLKGGEGDDVLSVSDLGFLRIVGGNGNDTLQLLGAGLSLDLTTTADNRILGVEQIDISGSGANTLILDLAEVLNISDESNTLIVTGDADDNLYLTTAWTFTGTETIGSTLHKVFSQNAATLKVADTVNLPINQTTITDPPSSTADTTPTIGWNLTLGAVRYEIHVYSYQTGQRIIFETNVTSTSFTPSSDLSLGSYQTFVRGINVLGNPANWVTPLTFTVVLPAAPTLTAPSTTTTDTTPTIGWNAVSGAAQYELHVYSFQTGQRVIFQNSLTGTSFTPSSDLALGSYQTFVRAINSFGNTGNWGTPLVFTVVAPASPVLTAPTATTTDTTPTIAWNSVTDAAIYELHVYSFQTGQQVIFQNNLSGTSFTPSSALVKGSYQIFVRGINSAGDAGSWSIPRVFEIVQNDVLESIEDTPTTDENLVPSESSSDTPILSVDILLAETDNHRSPGETVELRTVNDSLPEGLIGEKRTFFGAEHTLTLTAELDAVMTDWPRTDWWDNLPEQPGANRIADELDDISRYSTDRLQILAGAVMGVAMPFIKVQTATHPFDTKRGGSSNHETRRRKA